MATPFPIQDLRRLSRVSAARGAFDAVAVWSVVGLAWAFAATKASWWSYAIAVVVIGGRQSSLANLAHDAWHGLCFPKRSVNNAVGAWLYAYPIGIPFHHDRRRHLTHHNRVGFADDPDWVNYSNVGRETRGRVILFLAGRLFGSLLVSTLWSVLSRGKARIEVADHGGDLGGGREWLKVATTQLALAALLTLSLGWWGYPLLWLLPLASVAAFCNNLRAFVEHSAARDSAQPVERLRDYLPGPVEAAWFSPCHFHFHALHHAYPSIPHYRLPAAKRDLTAIGGSYPYVVAPGYLRALTQHLGQL